MKMMTRRNAIVASLLTACGMPIWSAEKKDGTLISVARVFLNLDQVTSLTVRRGKEEITLNAEDIWRALHE